MKIGLSIVIPALNEEVYLPGLLGAIRRQTRAPLEVIVSD
ncbi:MAG TPA: glycosyltransferase, partial [Clostridia bacterium]|nr:glycosyltransferase [Clostridia bacterium]